MVSIVAKSPIRHAKADFSPLWKAVIPWFRGRGAVPGTLSRRAGYTFPNLAEAVLPIAIVSG
ncbi:hypothetical protein SAMN04489752_0948 [Brevibacterium siliguriense]|uniref:Uncharacterized protein n=1 Tax=Brevibacterium siliguriense TaxID=1136497 RepID=A0A1H1PBV2_9MICO|nr:hypothetical protein SAMN04489752_0948 [Brevibacterium siliguriense]